MLLKSTQRQMTWTYNNHSKPIRVIFDFDLPIQELINQTIKEMNLVDDFKDDPSIKQILDNVESLIQSHHHCYLMERDQGGTVEIQTGRTDYYDSKF